MRPGEPNIQSRRTCNSPGSTYCSQSLREQRKPFPCLLWMAARIRVNLAEESGELT